MSSRIEIVYGIDEIERVAEQVRAQLKLPICILIGELGAGKTSLLKEILKSYEVQDEVTSPTYSIVNEYKTKAGETIYHFDLYRIKTEVELYDLGFHEYIDSKNTCFIEWPEIAVNMIPVQHHKIHIEYVSFKKRKLSLT
jgi:tRNA threonylcarbamoyladenosine biosynthesis protein TsaE